MKRMNHFFTVALCVAFLHGCEKGSTDDRWERMNCEDCTVGEVVETMRDGLDRAWSEPFWKMEREDDILHEGRDVLLKDENGNEYEKIRKIDFARDVYYCRKTGEFRLKYRRNGVRRFERFCPYTWRRDSLALVDSIKKVTGHYDPVRSFFCDTVPTRYGVLTPEMMDSLYDNWQYKRINAYSLAFKIADLSGYEVFYYDPFHDEYYRYTGSKSKWPNEWLTCDEDSATFMKALKTLYKLPKNVTYEQALAIDNKSTEPFSPIYIEYADRTQRFLSKFHKN